jgi:cytochrome c553
MKYAVIIMVVLAACSGRSSTKPPAPVTTTVTATPAALPVGANVPHGLLENLHMLATGRAVAPAMLADWQRKLGNGATVDDYIAQLVGDPEFAKTVAPRIVLRTGMRIGNTKLSVRLKKTRTGDKTVYHLRKPCEVGQAVPVKAWWLDGTQDVLVCPDSYEPDRRVIPKTDWYCGGGNANPLLSPTKSFCGCGPDLMYCYPDELFETAMNDMQDEVSNTIAHVVDKDLPLEQVFLQNETVRSGLADHHYDLWDVMTKKRDRHPPPGKTTRLAPRTEYFPGMHAGILTTPHMLFMPDAQRPRINRYSYVLFCSPMKSSAVHTDVVLGLRAGDTRNGEGWKSLVKMPGCTDCHARLDYGVRFFGGWLDVRKSIGFHPEAVIKEEGLLYMNDFTDLRGKAPVTTPRAFAELAVQQPEFARCQAQNVLDYVLGGDSTTALRDSLIATASPKLKLRDMMKVALRAYASRYTAKPKASPTVRASTDAGGSQLTLSPEMKAQLEACTDCHDGSKPELPNLSADKLPRELVQKSVAKVAFGAMPPDGFDEPARDAFLTTAVPLAWPAQAPDAYAFYENRMRSLQVHHAGSVIRAIHPQPGGDVEKLPEMSIEQHQAQLTPSFTTTMLLEQLKACKAKAGDVRACMRQFSMESMIRSPR